MALLAMSPLPVNGENIHKLDFGVIRSVHSCLRMFEEGFSLRKMILPVWKYGGRILSYNSILRAGRLTCKLTSRVSLIRQALLPWAQGRAARGAHKAVEGVKQGVPARHCWPQHRVLVMQKLLQTVHATCGCP